MTLQIIDSDDLAEAVGLSVRESLTPDAAIARVIAKNGRYWFADVRQLCAGCLASLDALERPGDIAVICAACRVHGERVHR